MKCDKQMIMTEIRWVRRRYIICVEEVNVIIAYVIPLALLLLNSKLYCIKLIKTLQLFASKLN